MPHRSSQPGHAVSQAGALFRQSALSKAFKTRRRFWIWPLLAAVLLMATGWYAQCRVEAVLKEELHSRLQVILDTVIVGQEAWFEDQKNEVRAIARIEELQAPIRDLTAISKQDEIGNIDELRVALRQSEAHQQVQEIMLPLEKLFHLISYLIISPDNVVLATDEPELLGVKLSEEKQQELGISFSGDSIVTRPFISEFPLKVVHGDHQLQQQPAMQQHVMYAACPVRKGESDEVIGMIGLRLDPHQVFSLFLNTAQMGETGETYAFDRNGTMLSESRFEDDLIDLGLLPDEENVSSMLYVELRDPGVDMTTGKRPKLRRHEQPLTRMAQHATQGQDGFDVEGYRDYRGVKVVGAWRWLPEYDFGVTTELDHAEAYAAVMTLRYVFRGLFGLVLLTTIVIGVASFYSIRLQRSMDQMVHEIQEMGQYQILEKIGQGGMGAVYKATHSLMRRPTAIKVLEAGKSGAAAISRFEREVQLTSRLNHPNTIVIYDYGRTPKGVFYYAMELIEGITLENLVKRYGVLPEGRIVYILSQVCGSLAEAHSIGLIHRDIKPANIMLTHRGGQPDVVKVLDFGLVKDVESEDQTHLTQDGSLLGTPMYMSPEEIESPETIDHRSDIYSLGGVAYFLLTGTPPFTGKSITEVCMHQLNTVPERPSQRRLGGQIHADLDDLVMRCLEKDPDKRPQSACGLLEELNNCQAKYEWGYEKGAEWWAENVVIEQIDSGAFNDPPQSTSEYTATVIVDEGQGTTENTGEQD